MRCDALTMWDYGTLWDSVRLHLRYNAFKDQVPWNRSLIPDYSAVAPILDKVGEDSIVEVLYVTCSERMDNDSNTVNCQQCLSSMLRFRNWEFFFRLNFILITSSSSHHDIIISSWIITLSSWNSCMLWQVLVYEPEQRCHACSILEAVASTCTLQTRNAQFWVGWPFLRFL